jgi:hypothetical protein
MNVTFTSNRCGLCLPASIQTATDVAQAVAGTVFYFENLVSHPQSVPCIVFVTDEFPIAITFETKCARLNEAMGFASRPARNRLPADDSYQTKANWKGSKS